MMRRCLVGATLAALCAVPLGAVASGEEAQQRVLQRVERLARGYDMNQQEKYHLDFHYSPLHAMALYRELLLWLDQPGVAAAVRTEWLATVSAGMEAVVRHSGAGPAPEQGPLGIGFLRAAPRYTQLPDPARPETLAWRSEGMEARTTPAAVGKSLSAKALLLSRLPAAAPERPWLLASLRREYDELAGQLLTLTAQGYMPEVAAWEGGRWSVQDGRSRLFSQAALLRGLLETEAALAALGGAEKAWRSRVQRSVETLFSGIVQRHQDEAAGSVVDVHDPQQGRGDRVMLEDMALWLEALALLHAQQPQGSPLRAQAERLGRTQLAFLLRALAAEGLPPRGYRVRDAVPLRTTVHSLEEPLAALSMLQHAARFGVADAAETQRRISTLLENDYWSAEAGVFRSAAGFTASAYDGHLVALTLRWLRREGAAEAQQRGAQLLQVVVKQAGLLQCESPQSGEPLSLEQALAQRAAAFAAEVASLPAVEQGQRIAAFVRSIADQDGDGLPGCRFAAGHFGGAPVPVIQTSVRTPFPAVKK